jgi:RNA polymerase sigma factor (sigma-70 family)
VFKRPKSTQVNTWPPQPLRPTPDMPDELLVDLHTFGSGDALGILFERHRPVCLSIASRILRNATQAEDEVQVAFLSAYTAFATFEGRSTFGAWLKSIVTNQCRRRARTDHRRQTDACDEVVAQARSHGKSPEQCVAEAEVIEVACREIRRLPAPMRYAFRSVVLEGKSLQQFSVQVGVTRAAAKSRLARARQEIQQRMQKYHGAMGAFTLLR